MAHPEQQQFVQEIKGKYPNQFKDCYVLEVGSQDINGSVRGFFENCQYTGLDCNPGRSVDVVCLAHEFDSNRQFDTIISCEAFEHDPYLDRTLCNIIRLLRPGGLFLATCAGPNRQEHGTVRTRHKENTDAPHGPDPSFYRNGVVCDFQWALALYFDPLDVQTVRGDTDLQLWGIRNDRLSLAQQCSGS